MAPESTSEQSGSVAGSKLNRAGVKTSVMVWMAASALRLTSVGDLLLSVLGGGDNHGGHVIDVTRGLLKCVQLLVAALGLHLQSAW